MTGVWLPRMTSACRPGWRIMSGVIVVPDPPLLLALSVAAAEADRSVKAAWPQSSLAIFSVAVSVMPGSRTLTPQVSGRPGRRPCPTGAQLRFAVRDRDELDALPAGVGQPRREQGPARSGRSHPAPSAAAGPAARPACLPGLQAAT
jgi:hypothetical protein